MSEQPPRNSSSRETQAAVYIAGTWVMADTFRRRIVKAQIAVGDDWPGRIYYAVSLDLSSRINAARRHDPVFRARVEQAAMISVAGPVALALFKVDYDWEAAMDVGRARQWLGELTRSDAETEAYFNWIRQRAISVFAQSTRWLQVQGVSSALVKGQMLGDQRVRPILRRFAMGSQDKRASWLANGAASAVRRLGVASDGIVSPSIISAVRRDHRLVGTDVTLQTLSQTEPHLAAFISAEAMMLEQCDSPIAGEAAGALRSCALLVAESLQRAHSAVWHGCEGLLRPMR
jgi:hypothetical protein